MTNRPTYVMQRGFSLPYESGLGGDGYVPTMSAMGTVSETSAYKNTAFIPEAHTSLPNANATLEAIADFYLLDELFASTWQYPSSIRCR